VKLFFRDDVRKECPSSAPHSDSEEMDRPSTIFTHPRNLLKVFTQRSVITKHALGNF